MVGLHIGNVRQILGKSRVTLNFRFNIVICLSQLNAEAAQNAKSVRRKVAQKAKPSCKATTPALRLK
jgi:hypothetical protein